MSGACRAAGAAASVVNARTPTLRWRVRPVRRDIVEEYRTIEAGAGWIDRAARGRIRFEGRDAASFLQALLTNDVLRVQRGEGVYAAYLTPQGRMITDIDVLHRGGWLFGSVPDGLGASMAARFDQLIFSEDLTVSDVSSLWTEIAVAGGDASVRVARALAEDAARLAALPELSQIDYGDGFVVRGGDAPWPMFRIVVPVAERGAIVSALEQHGVVPMSAEVAETLRVEAGRPLWGRELTADTIPLEAGLLERAISTSKGCYVGQEIIIRILHRGGGRVAKRLMTVMFGATVQEPPAPGTSLLADGHAVGHVTSAVYSPARDAIVALAYVHRDAAAVGRVLTIDGGGTGAIVA
jgi:folate-binding protein YgfZ